MTAAKAVLIAHRKALLLEGAGQIVAAIKVLRSVLVEHAASISRNAVYLYCRLLVKGSGFFLMRTLLLSVNCGSALSQLGKRQRPSVNGPS
jgi:hypothetical protein